MTQTRGAPTSPPAPSLGPGRGAWVLERPEPYGISRAQLDAAAARTRAAMRERYCLLVAVDGHLVGEYYFANSSETLYESDSLGKTMVAQIVGVAVTQGLIDLDRPLAAYGVVPRCADGNAAAASSPPVNETCARVLRAACSHYAPPWDSAGRRASHLPEHGLQGNVCSAGCLSDPDVLRKLAAAGCSAERDGASFCAAPNAGRGCWVDSNTGRDYWPNVTARHLLTQTTGVGNYAPGSRFTYDSDQYIDHLAYLISKVTGEESAVWATREYAIPLGLPPDIFAYDGFEDPLDGTEFSPGGGQMMTCRDHLRVAQLLINKGRWYADDGVGRSAATPEGYAAAERLFGAAGDGVQKQRPVVQLLSEDYVAQFLRPSFPEVVQSYGFLTWLNRPVNEDGCCSPRWGSPVSAATDGTPLKPVNTCQQWVTPASSRSHGQMIGDSMYAGGQPASVHQQGWLPEVARAPVDLALGMGMSAKYSIIVPSQGLAAVSIGLSWSSSVACPLGAYPLDPDTQALSPNGTKIKRPLKANSPGYDDSWSSTQFWRSLGNISAALEKSQQQGVDGQHTIRLRRSAELAPRAAQVADHDPTMSATAWNASSRAARSFGAGACYAYCPPGMGFGFCFNMPKGTPKGDCSSVAHLAPAVCPSHGAPRQCQSPSIPADWDCESVELDGMRCRQIGRGCGPVEPAGEAGHGLPPANPAYDFSTCLCEPDFFVNGDGYDNGLVWTAEACVYSPFTPPAPIPGF